MPKTLNPGKDAKPATFTLTPGVKGKIAGLAATAGCSRSDLICELVLRCGDQVALQLRTERMTDEGTEAMGGATVVQPGSASA